MSTSTVLDTGSSTVPGGRTGAAPPRRTGYRAAICVQHSSTNAAFIGLSDRDDPTKQEDH